jgi:uncharacterized protein YgiM (DUF1202 family)
MSRSLTTALIAGIALTAGAASAGTIAVPAPQIPESGYQTVQDKTMIVTATAANLRADPSPQGQIVTTVPKNTQVTVKGMSTDNRWVHVQTPSGAEGYIDLRLLK